MYRTGSDRCTKECSRWFCVLAVLAAFASPVRADGARSSVDSFVSLPAAIAFREGRYLDAAALFAEELRRRPQDPLLLRYLALSHYQLRDFETADRVFERGLALDPANEALLFHAARNDLALGRRGRAIERFEQILEVASGSRYGSEALLMLQAIGAAKPSQASPDASAKRWRAFVQLGYEYDSNIIAAPEDAPQNRSGHRLFEYGSGSFDWYRAGKWVLRSGASAYLSQHQERFDEFDLVSVTGHTLASYRTKILGTETVLRSGYEFNASVLDDKSYSTSHRIEAGGFAQIASAMAIDLDYQLSFNAFRFDGFSPDISSRDGERHELEATYYVFGDNWRQYGWVRFLFDWNTAEGRNFDYRALGGEIGARVSLPRKLSLDGRVSVEKINYRNYVFQPRRQTTRTVARLDLSRDLPRRAQAHLGYYYGHDDSTVPLFDYDRHIVTVSVSKSY